MGGRFSPGHFAVGVRYCKVFPDSFRSEMVVCSCFICPISIAVLLTSNFQGGKLFTKLFLKTYIKCKKIFGFVEVENV